MIHRIVVGCCLLLVCCGGDPAPAASADAALAAGDASGAADTTDAAATADVATPPLPAPKPAELDAPGPFGIGMAQITAEDPARGRKVTMTLWYPTAPAADAGTPVHELFYSVNGMLQQLYAKAPAGCPNPLAHGLTGAAPLPGAPFPLVAFSHCSGCFRASSFSLAERLASHGIAVVAPDHPPNTVFETLIGKAQGLSADMLATRVADIRFALDVVLDPVSPALPEPLRGRFDPQRVGAYGHSFGALTTGRVLAEDPRVRAGVAVAAPLSAPAPPGPDLKQLHKPVLLLLAQEDNSIFEIGNLILRENFAQAAGPAWLVEVADAGHFTFSDVAQLMPSWKPGCGEDTRQTDSDVTFTYLAPAKGRAIGARVVAAFFARFLLDLPAATDALALPWPATVTVQQRP